MNGSSSHLGQLNVPFISCQFLLFFSTDIAYLTEGPMQCNIAKKNFLKDILQSQQRPMDLPDIFVLS